MPAARRIDPTILRANDIRGTYGRDLTEADAEAIGAAFGTIVRREGGMQVAVGYDGRLSSPPLEEALVAGLARTGVTALRIGLGPSPMLYFAVKHHHLDGGVMITGSHNPGDMNGMKFMLGQRPFYGDRIRELGNIAESGAYAEGAGAIEPKSVMDDYVTTLAAAYRSKQPRKVAWDAGNGATGPVLERLVERLPGRHELLFTEIDGSFPNHHPDPTEPHNLVDLIERVKKADCELGFGFDGDGDRIGIVDPNGRIVWGDQMLALMAEPILRERPGATIIADVKASQSLFDRVAELGGTPLMWKTGHAFIKEKMVETNAPLAGEMSGHIFFADRYYGYDDGLYAAMRFLDLASSWPEGIIAKLNALPKVLNTPELRFPCADNRKFQVIEEVRRRLNDLNGAKVITVDGLRVVTPEGWWLLRASNTQAVLVGRCEAQNDAGLSALKSTLKAQLALSGLSTDIL